jgi:hypothetical protein
MGFFGTYLFDGKRWTPLEPGGPPEAPDPWLYVDIHDSDIGTIAYSPVGPGTGVAYLGFTPRTYFEDDTASEPTDVAREADGLATWWAALHPDATDVIRTAKAAELRAFLAEDDAIPDEDAENMDDADVFVEFKAALFLRALGLPTPDELTG